MFTSLPKKLRSYNIPSDARTVLLLQRCMEKDLIQTVGDLYTTLKHIVVKDPRHIGPYTIAFYDYFLNIQIGPGQTVNDAIMRSQAFKHWLDDQLYRNPGLIEQSAEELVDRFLNHVHLTHYDIKKVISGKDILDNNEAEKPDEDGDISDNPGERYLDRMADYSSIDLSELLDRLDKIAEQQKTKHAGGDHWIGTGGISPFGHGGAARGGIRIGGTGGGKMARRVLNDRNYFPVERHQILNDNNVDAALASLKGIYEESASESLDVKKTIREGLRKGGLFIPELKNDKSQKLRVIVLIDNGGYSMSPYIKVVRELFKKMKTRFSHDMKTFYFHNTIYDRVYEDDKRRKPVKLDTLLSNDSDYRVFIIGDAAMAPYELNRTSLRALGKVRKKFKQSAWLNPEPERYWKHGYTIQLIGQIFPMFALTPAGIEKAVLAMNKKYR